MIIYGIIVFIAAMFVLIATFRQLIPAFKNRQLTQRTFLLSLAFAVASAVIIIIGSARRLPPLGDRGIAEILLSKIILDI